jgi:hypothetical protein
VGTVADEGVELLERAGVEQLLDPLAGGELALCVLLLDRLLGGGVDRRLAELSEVGELLLVGLGELFPHQRAILWRAQVPSTRDAARRSARPSGGDASASDAGRPEAFPWRPRWALRAERMRLRIHRGACRLSVVAVTDKTTLPVTILPKL